MLSFQLSSSLSLKSSSLSSKSSSLPLKPPALSLESYLARGLHRVEIQNCSGTILQGGNPTALLLMLSKIVLGASPTAPWTTLLTRSEARIVSEGVKLANGHTINQVNHKSCEALCLDLEKESQRSPS